MNIQLTTAMAAKALKAIYKADRANVYINPKDVTFLLKVRTPAFENEFWEFAPTNEKSLEQDKYGNIFEAPVTRVTLKKYGKYQTIGKQGVIVCDGATGAPDTPKGVKNATGLHDPGYLSIRAVVDRWYKAKYDPGPLFSRDMFARAYSKIASDGSETWTEADVRQLFDAMFGDTIRKGGGKPWVVRSYYSVVRWTGGVFRQLSGSAKLLLLAGSMLAVTGCTGGCMSPPDILDFPEGVPELQQTQSGDLNGDVIEIIKEAVKP